MDRDEFFAQLDQLTPQRDRGVAFLLGQGTLLLVQEYFGETITAPWHRRRITLHRTW